MTLYQYKVEYVDYVNIQSIIYFYYFSYQFNINVFKYYFTLCTQSLHN